jgi:hypothetical protein
MGYAELADHHQPTRAGGYQGAVHEIPVKTASWTLASAGRAGRLMSLDVDADVNIVNMIPPCSSGSGFPAHATSWLPETAPPAR